MNRLALQLSRCANRNSLSYLIKYNKTNSSSRSLIFNSIRNMASQPATSNTNNNNNNVTQSSTTNELDKPQWERSDRYKIYYGFSSTDEAEDKAQANFLGWGGLFFFICMPMFLIYYYPDYKNNEWCYREAHLELSRREKAGVELVSPDLIPVDRIKLPSDQEIGDMEIII